MMPFQRKKPAFLIFLSLFFGLSIQDSYARTTSAYGKNGMVVTAHHLASRVGIDVLQNGGNAIDAAVAVGYALAVVYPSAGNLGGGGFMTIRLKDGTAHFLDFREHAPLAAKSAMFLDSKGQIIQGASTLSYLAVGIPGTVAGLEFARENYGSQRRRDLINPAYKLAKEGFILEQGDITSFAQGFSKIVTNDAASQIFLDKGQPFKAGMRLQQTDLAKSLAAIADHGTDAFYKGTIQELIVKSSQQHSGILASSDFESYKIREFEPVRCNYRGYDILSAPPPSSGGVILCEMLNIIEGYPITELGYNTAASLQPIIEAMRHAYFDRNSRLGDPSFTDNPVEEIISKKYAEEIRGHIEPNRAGISPKPTYTKIPESNETTHYSIIDSEGNAVSVTYTLNGAFGTGIVAEGTGILLNNQMDDFTSKIGAANTYGLIQNQLNAIAPGKTPLSSMSPTIISKNQKPFMIIGSPGGSRIITINLAVIMNVIDYGMTIENAINAARIHHQWLPDIVYAEFDALTAETTQNLQTMGYKIHIDDNVYSWGSAAGILIKNNTYHGVIDKRSPSGSALGH